MASTEELRDNASGTRYQVTEAYQTRFTDPIHVSKGERVQMGRRDTEFPGWTWVTTEDGNGGWAPDQLLQPEDDATTTFLDDYDATELNTVLGEKLSLVRETNGWGLMQRENGDLGWVPMNTMSLCDT